MELPTSDEYTLALEAYQAGDHASALRRLERLKKANSQNPDIYILLGNIYHHQHQSEWALEQYHLAFSLKPDSAPIAANIGIVLFELARYWEAIAHFQQALQLCGDYAIVFLYLGKTLQALNLWPQAERAYREYIRLQPKDYRGYDQLGFLFVLQHHLTKATHYLRQSLQLEPNQVAAFDRIGQVLYSRGQLAEAIVHYRDAFVEHNWYHQLNPDTQHELLRYRPLFHSQLLLCLYSSPGLTDEMLMAQLKIWAQLYADPLTPPHLGCAPNREPNRRLRIGYVSLEFDYHSSAPSVLLLLQQHDHSQFEIFAYSDVTSPDDMTKQFKQCCHHWRDIAGLDNTLVAQMIQADQIDILVDLMGHTYASRLLMFALRPAPIQVTGLGFGCPTGLQAMDYFFADPVFMPAEVAPLLTEKIAPLSCQIYWKPPDLDIPIAASPFTANGYVTFGSGSQLYKINDQVFETWCKILQLCPTAHLALKTTAFEDPLLCQEWLQKFADYGIGRERIRLQGISSQAEHLKFYGTLDIVLVPFPYSGGISTYESLWMGTPVIAMNRIHRTSASILRSLGRQEWIADNILDYIERAVALANCGDTLKQVRFQLRHELLQSPICDGQSFAREVEAGYRNMWQQWIEQTTA